MGDTRDPPPAIVGDVGVFLQGRRLTARHLPDGAPLWSFDGDGTLQGAPIVAGDRVYVGGGSGVVYGLDLATGAERWRGDAGAPILSPKNALTVYKQGMAVSDRSLVVNTTNGMVAFVGRPAAPDAQPVQQADG